jgi:RecA-family ATPase
MKLLVDAAEIRAAQQTAWRMEGTLREFPKFPPKNLYFSYPVHEEDRSGILQDLQTDSELTPWQRGARKGHRKQSQNAKAKAADKNAELINTFNAVNVDGSVTVQEIAEYIGVSEKTIRRRLSSSNDFTVENNIVKRSGTN